MFYEPKDGHGLPHNPFNAIVTPRPIGWVSTRDKDGRDNLAPYSFFNAVAYTPPQVMFSSTGTKDDREESKDSVSVIRETGVFCINIVSQVLTDAMNISSKTYPAGTDEFERAGLEKASCNTINCPRVAASPASLECVLNEVITLRGSQNYLVLGEVTGVHLADDCMSEGRFDVTRFRPLARLGYRDYSVVDNIFTLSRPDD